MSKDGFRDDFRRNFLTGLAALFPIVITLFLFVWLYRQADRAIGERVGSLAVRYLASEERFEEAYPNAPTNVAQSEKRRRAYVREQFPDFVGVVFGLCVVVIGVYLVGKVLRGYFGRRAMEIVDNFFERFPVVKNVYPHARQVGNFLFGVSDHPRFNKVVAVQYPRKGIFSVGFATGQGIKDISDRARRELVTIFIPTSPTPLTGFIIMVPADEVISVDMTVEEAFRYCITAGMLVPRRQALSEEHIAQLEEINEMAGPTPDEAETGQPQDTQEEPGPKHDTESSSPPEQAEGKN
jgi:uncharacterized membrane protein